MIKNYLLAIAIAIAVLFACLYSCGSGVAYKASEFIKQEVNKLHASNAALDDTIETTRETVKVIRTKIEYRDKEVVKWKQRKANIIYITSFDSSATASDVHRELIKCDSVVRVDSVIIAAQDTTIKDQRRVISLKDSEITATGQKLENKDKEIELKAREVEEAKKLAGKRERKGFGLGLGIGFIIGLLVPL